MRLGARGRPRPRPSFAGHGRRHHHDCARRWTDQLLMPRCASRSRCQRDRVTRSASLPFRGDRLPSAACSASCARRVGQHSRLRLGKRYCAEVGCQSCRSRRQTIIHLLMLEPWASRAPATKERPCTGQRPQGLITPRRNLSPAPSRRPRRARARIELDQPDSSVAPLASSADPDRLCR
jgi:hypothetical protein